MRQRSLPFVLWIVSALIAIFVITWALAQNRYNCDWTGFGECLYTKGANQDLRPEKTLWDWLSLLGVPAVLASIGLLFNARQMQAEQRHAEAEQQRVADLAEDSLLREFFDRLSDLLLKNKLRESQREDEVRSVARSRTLATLRRLNGERKASLLHFLYESNLIIKAEPYIELKGADLKKAVLTRGFFSEADFRGVDLRGAVLKWTDLPGADLRGADLRGADLEWAYLRGATLSEANLSQANLSEAYLSEAVLRGTVLTEANLSRANLSKVDFSRADLRGALLRGADLSEATITPQQLDTCLSLEGATMSDGTKHP